MNAKSSGLITKLARYQSQFGNEATVDRLRDFLVRQPACFDRDCYDDGHVTGSAWVLSSDRKRALLNHHAKLGKWLQFGGHSDGDSDTLAVALREAKEESGLHLRPLSAEIFDIDIHEIPAHARAPEHIHYDVRFAFEVIGSEVFMTSTESHELRWVCLHDVAAFTSEESVLRMVAKTRHIL